MLSHPLRCLCVGDSTPSDVPGAAHVQELVVSHGGIRTLVQLLPLHTPELPSWLRRAYAQTLSLLVPVLCDAVALLVREHPRDAAFGGGCLVFGWR